MARKAVNERIPMRRLQMSHGIEVPGLRTADHILLDTYEGPDGLAKLLRYLRQLPEGTTEIMCHPGYVDDSLVAISQLREEREQELTVFRSPLIQETIRTLQLPLIHY
jgi:predicted glycoside hydrolase/deacetylase ChbG (UPF0249 family)